jgi:hypothetical protein
MTSGVWDSFLQEAHNIFSLLLINTDKSSWFIFDAEDHGLIGKCRESCMQSLALSRERSSFHPVLDHFRFQVKQKYAFIS